MEIPRHIADREGLPEDLDSSVRGPYEMPSPHRRRIGAVSAGTAGGIAALGAWAGLPDALYVVAGGLLVLAGHHWWTAWDLGIRELAALEAANPEVGFPVGHASAALGFRGWRSRPVWNVLLYSADEPPTKRGLVRVDAVDGRVIDSYVEEVPEATS